MSASSLHKYLNPMLQIRFVHRSSNHRNRNARRHRAHKQNGVLFVQWNSRQKKKKNNVKATSLLKQSIQQKTLSPKCGTTSTWKCRIDRTNSELHNSSREIGGGNRGADRVLPGVGPKQLGVGSWKLVLWVRREQTQNYSKNGQNRKTTARSSLNCPLGRKPLTAMSGPF